MRIGVGLPNGIQQVSRAQLLDWCRRAEREGFSAIGALDRFNYGCLEPLVALSAAAAVTERIELATTIIAGPPRDRATIGEQVVTLGRLAPDRFTLGLGLGGRPEDYAHSEFPWTARAARLDELLEWLQGIRCSSGPPVVVGGHSEAAFRRVARFADGYVSSGGPASLLDRQFRAVERAWRAEGRSESPSLWATAYFALGAHVERGRAFLASWYAASGSFGEKVVAGLLVDRDGVRETIRAYRGVGCDLLVFLPTVADVEQVGALAAAVEDSRAAGTHAAAEGRPAGDVPRHPL